MRLGVGDSIEQGGAFRGDPVAGGTDRGGEVGDLGIQAQALAVFLLDAVIRGVMGSPGPRAVEVGEVDPHPAEFMGVGESVRIKDVSPLTELPGLPLLNLRQSDHEHVNGLSGAGRP
ncbi:hypothetical protein [Nocardia sp. CNY236]|uniref:hypothetical protein n=1 Tax=Nocardia sp. CNY236 TaxID=1169152 RepID=UPI0012DCB0C0|nr:hypothetical protein [Nocardia sp. CNY236]